MKFSHGAWLWERNVTPQCVKRISEYRIEGSTLSATGLDRTGNDGVDRFEGLVLELRVTSPMPNVIRVQAQHHQGKNILPFDLDYEMASGSAEIKDSKEDLDFTSGDLSLRLKKGPPWELRFESHGQLVTEGGSDSLGYMTVDGKKNFIMQRLSLAVGECIYGMGERFGPLVKNGQTVSIWNEDGGTVSDLAYKNIPFYLSSRGYGLLVNSPGRVEFEVATERVSQIQFSVEQEQLDYYVFYGPALKDVLDKYTRLSGRPAVPPAWSFGLWLSTSFTTQYNEQTVNEFIDGMAQRDIPLRVFHFDCFWMKERHWCDFEWDTEAFPDPAGMLSRLKTKGLKICLWINPYISQLSKLFAEGEKHGYLVKRPDGSVYQRDAWQPGMGLVDFTNPVACKWYCKKLEALLDMGADCFKTDFGELIPVDVAYHDGSDPALMHNFYAYLYNKAVFELLEKYHGKGNAMVFARSASAGSQKFPIHWGGDCFANFESMAEDLRGGLSFCMSGPAFWSHDIGGFAGKANPSLYKRWVAFGLLSTHSRLHGSESYRVPWIFDEESVDVMRHFVHLKNSLFPYLFAAAHDANQHGWPVMRAMVIEFPGDPACLYLDRQYMLGSSLLIAPVFRQDNVAEYYLPNGKWTHFISGKVVEGGRWQKEVMDFNTLPLFVRENSMIAISADKTRTQWLYADELVLQLFAIVEGPKISVSVPPSDNQTPAIFNVQRIGNDLTIEGDGRAKNVKLLIRSGDVIKTVSNGQQISQTTEGTLFSWQDMKKPISLSTR